MRSVRPDYPSRTRGRPSRPARRTCTAGPKENAIGQRIQDAACHPPALDHGLSRLLLKNTGSVVRGGPGRAVNTPVSKHAENLAHRAFKGVASTAQGRRRERAVFCRRDASGFTGTRSVGGGFGGLRAGSGRWAWAWASSGRQSSRSSASRSRRGL